MLDLQSICCPETHQDLGFAARDLVLKINERIAAGTVSNRAGQLVREPIENGLMRQDRKYLYPIRQGIPVLLIHEAIPLPG